MVVYRTPYSRLHQVTVTTFLDEFAEYLESIVLSPEPLFVTGDMNIHVDDVNDTNGVKFLDLLESIRSDLRASRLCQDPPELIIDLVSCYNTTLSDLLDKHAPLLKKTITVHPRVPWFNVTVREAKEVSTKHERIWQRTRCESDRERFAKSQNHANHVLKQARRDYYLKFIEENSIDQRRLLFKATSALLVK